MKKTVLTFGFISGAVLSVMMLLTMPFMERIGFDHGLLIGYTSMVLAFLLVFFGVRSYRDNVAGGRLTFARGFVVGLLITLIACACYVATWEFIYFKLAPDFVDKWSAYMVEKARASGASEAEVQRTVREMQAFKQWYAKPLLNVAATFLEPLPVGLAMTLVAAAALRRSSPAPKAMSL